MLNGMDWCYIEYKYRTLKEDYDNAWNAWVDAPSDDEKYTELSVAKSKYWMFCVDVLEQLMEQNADVLERLKKI